MRKKLLRVVLPLAVAGTLFLGVGVESASAAIKPTKWQIDRTYKAKPIGKAHFKDKKLSDGSHQRGPFQKYRVRRCRTVYSQTGSDHRTCQIVVREYYVGRA
jgi:hypothetical protein